MQYIYIIFTRILNTFDEIIIILLHFTESLGRCLAVHEMLTPRTSIQKYSDDTSGKAHKVYRKVFKQENVYDFNLFIAAARVLQLMRDIL